MGPGPAIGPGFGEPVSLPGSTLPQFPNSAEDIKDLESWRDALADKRVVELLKIIDEAASLENARYDTDYTRKPSYEIGSPSHLRYVDLIAQLLTVRAVLAMADGNRQAAYQDVTLGYRLAYWVGQEHPGSSNAHMSGRLASRFWESTQRLFRSSPPNKQQRDALVAEAKRLMEAEFIIRGTMTQRIIASEMSDLWNSRSRAGGQPDARVWLMNYLLRPWAAAYGAYMLDLHTRMIEMSKEPYYQKSLQEKQFRKDHPAPWYLGLPPIAPYPSLPRYHLRTQVFMLQIACLLEDYREEKGNYPDSLDILTDVPLDPYGGGPFHYQLKDGGYILYSISANLQDDGGTPPSATSTWDPEGDIVWTMQPK
jgi:hypothetical protein